MITKSYGRYTKKQKRNKRVKKVLSWLGWGLGLLMIGIMYAITFFWLFYNYLPK